MVTTIVGAGSRGGGRRPTLRLFGGGVEGSPCPPGSPGRAHRWRFNGCPVEVRIWLERPDDADAVHHPSGVWLSIRVV